ncbi:hypothetical protein GDO78_017819 [Eleutherodactylus coqui]|uniref:Uncharacterized protein n=1 Tax=Eleutherodactylus coqui TaxID=57060 RepID=A0A8J6AZR5_ELECQ|nr:hypothetical protein GDO78_017819 [Eleutherodactylus coqui]
MSPEPPCASTDKISHTVICKTRFSPLNLELQRGRTWYVALAAPPACPPGRGHCGACDCGGTTGELPTCKAQPGAEPTWGTMNPVSEPRVMLTRVCTLLSVYIEL